MIGDYDDELRSLMIFRKFCQDNQEEAKKIVYFGPNPHMKSYIYLIDNEQNVYKYGFYSGIFSSVDKDETVCDDDMYLNDRYLNIHSDPTPQIMFLDFLNKYPHLGPYVTKYSGTVFPYMIDVWVNLNASEEDFSEQKIIIFRYNYLTKLAL